jgi:hypothetical protein
MVVRKTVSDMCFVSKFSGWQSGFRLLREAKYTERAGVYLIQIKSMCCLIRRLLRLDLTARHEIVGPMPRPLQVIIRKLICSLREGTRPMFFAKTIEFYFSRFRCAREINGALQRSVGCLSSPGGPKFGRPLNKYRLLPICMATKMGAIDAPQDIPRSGA